MEPVEVVKQIYEAFGRGDIPGVLSRVTPDVSWVDPGFPDVPYAGVRSGREGVADFFQSLRVHVELTSFEAQHVRHERPRCRRVRRVGRPRSPHGRQVPIRLGDAVEGSRTASSPFTSHTPTRARSRAHLARFVRSWWRLLGRGRETSTWAAKKTAVGATSSLSSISPTRRVWRSHLKAQSTDNRVDQKVLEDVRSGPGRHRDRSRITSQERRANPVRGTSQVPDRTLCRRRHTDVRSD